MTTTTNVVMRMDRNLKKQAEILFEDMGINMTIAVTIFVKAAVKQGKIPFEITGDPFHREANQARSHGAIAALESGPSTVHELIEVNDLDRI